MHVFAVVRAKGARVPKYTRTSILEERLENGTLSARLPALASELPPPEHIDTVAFNFMKGLAQEIHTGKLSLPSLPEVAIKIRHALVEEHTDLGRVVRVIGTDPVLAARIVTAANSAAMRATRPISDVHSAVHRLGLQAVYSLAMSTALQQVLYAKIPDKLRSTLKAEWECSVRVAVIAQALARVVGGCVADEAFLAGLFHNIGKLFILKRAADYPGLLEDDDALQMVMDAWHNVVGFALVTHWGVASDIACAVRDHGASGTGEGANRLTSVVCLAHRHAGYVLVPGEQAVRTAPPSAGLELTDAAWAKVVAAARTELEYVRHVLKV